MPITSLTDIPGLALWLDANDSSTLTYSVLYGNGSLMYYYTFDTSLNSIALNLVSQSYDCSINATNSTISTAETSYPFMGVASLKITAQYAGQVPDSNLAHYNIVRIPSNTSTSYTATMWFNISSIPKGGAIFGTQGYSPTSTTSDTAGLGIWFPSNQMYIGSYQGTQLNNNYNLSASTTVPTFSNTGWYFMSVTVITSSSTVENMYVKIISNDKTNNTNNLNLNNTITFSSTIVAPTIFYFGSIAGYTGQTSLGYYDNFRFYNNALTPAQELNLYYNNTDILNTTNNFILNITYNLTTIQTSTFKDALLNSFIGGSNASYATNIVSRNCISVTNGAIYTTISAITSNSFSITTNFCQTTLTNADIFNVGGTPNAGVLYRFYIDTNNSNKLTGTNGTNVVVFSALTVNTWYHVTVAFTNTSTNTYSYKLYINGVAQTPASGSTSSVSVASFTTIGLGYNSSASTSYYNYWKLFNYALSDSDVNTIYTNDIA